MVEGLPTVKTPQKLCTYCLIEKQHRDPIPKRNLWRATHKLQLGHSYICGPISPISNSNKRLAPADIVAEAIRKFLIKLYHGNLMWYSELKVHKRRKERDEYFDLFKEDYVNRLTQATQNDNNVDGSEKLQLWKEVVGEAESQAIEASRAREEDALANARADEANSGQAGRSIALSSIDPNTRGHYDDDSDEQPADLEEMSDECFVSIITVLWNPGLCVMPVYATSFDSCRTYFVLGGAKTQL
ncbi:hypothetical protein KIW84_056281 [Lathyrus oleraceus]|uniref:Uncharacterized protein n=1 Tax=Pisum sativum TaxID=3888 RepID=A0A9D4WXQ9_PEA|nr:hypothetical protein KIW84_056281 [Pisum sativum]